MTDPAEDLARAEQAAKAWAQFMEPAFAVARSDYEAKLTKLYAEPETDKIERARVKLALAIRVLNETEAQIKALMFAGEKARQEKGRADRIAELPSFKKMGIAFS